jgi:hypothetical protein
VVFYGNVQTGVSPYVEYQPFGYYSPLGAVPVY